MGLISAVASAPASQERSVRWEKRQGEKKRATAGVTEGEAGKGVEAVSGSHVGEMSAVLAQLGRRGVTGTR